ncbi:unnamed protein product [Rotaria magnacalcarata]|uniref:Uncharacterized protein n=1 Tax=Rotaria magnacalcarata TaxID=392030 RepID=A0A816G5Y4_9BILA|nr:unnamed protein product [Rotaria magnacalcarata]CAF4915302.1 unnamed protein product [Rotaria magnacalcarata]
MNIHFNNQNINHRPAHMSATRPPPLTTTSYIHLRPCINTKPNLYGAAQRKHSYPYRKFQTGSTTTFSGYTNISNYHNKNNYREQRQHNTNDNDNNMIHSKSLNSKKIPSLMSFDVFQKPPRKNRRKIQHVEQYKQQALLHQHDTNRHDDENTNNNNYNMNVNQQRISSSTRSLEKFNGLILSDSMCRYVRPDKVSSNNIEIKISFESGCDCSKMLKFLEQQQIDQTSIFQADFVLFSLCTNDVANLGPNLALQNCRVLIERVKEMFPRLKLIGWLALSPRSKPSKLFNSVVIDQIYCEFNQRLQMLSKELNIEMINANLQHQHMHYDGLHPSLQSGRDLIEKAIYNWFMRKTKEFSNPSIHYHTTTNNQPINYNTTDKRNYIRHHYNNENTHENNNNNTHNNRNYRITTNHNNYYNSTDATTRTSYRHHHNHPITTINKNTNDDNKSYTNNNNNKNKNYALKRKENLNNVPSKSLLSHYPHFLRHKDEFFRKVTIPAELEEKKRRYFSVK